MPVEHEQGGAKPVDREIFLSDLLNAAVMMKGKKVGSLADLVIVKYRPDPGSPVHICPATVREPEPSYPF